MYIKTEFEAEPDEKNKTFEERVGEWNNLKKAYGRESKEAGDYHKNNILPETIQKCAANTREHNHGHGLTDTINPDYMILTVGFSYEPLVLSISYIKPRKKILFLYTSRTVGNKDKVVDFLAIAAGDYISKEVDSDSMEKIDREIKEQYGRWQEEYKADDEDLDKNGRVVIDFSGGTKAMAAGGALAGSVIDTKLIYVGSTYDESNQPKPGTEYIESIKNPYDLYAVTQLQNRIITESYKQRDYFSRCILALQETANRNINDLRSAFKKSEHADSSAIFKAKVQIRNDIFALNNEIDEYERELFERQKSCNDKSDLEGVLKGAETAFKNFDIRLQELENKVNER